MAKGNILKEAIADAKAVRDVASSNAKAALEEAFTPKLQNMLSARLQEDLDEMDMYDEDDDNLELGEIGGDHGEEDSMDEEIDLEEILNELEIEEGKEADDDEVVSEEKSDDDEEEIEEIHKVGQPNYKADGVHDVLNKASDVNDNLAEDKEFDLDALLKEINNLEEQAPSMKPAARRPAVTKGPRRPTSSRQIRDLKRKSQRPKSVGNSRMVNASRSHRMNKNRQPNRSLTSPLQETKGCRAVERELKEVKKVLEVKTNELNEVNLLNSKLLYVNRIFKANQLDDSQKLRVVETLDKADSTKEAKLIYETIKDTFKVANSKKGSGKKRSKTIKENFRGMASKAAGMSRTKKVAPKKAIIFESDNMVNRFQKLANIKISE